jgi:NADH-quinone oxidoreductase subunit I
MSVLFEMLENFFRKPFTILYPNEKVPVPDTFRGRISIDDQKCIGCSKCSLVCSVQCITMADSPKEIEFKGKTLTRKKKPQIKIFKCIRCGLCERHCPTGAISLKNELSDSGVDKELVVI